MGRPRSFDRDQAVAEAMHVFWSDGYDGASLPRLTSRLGINSPSLYAAFGSKRGLFDEAAALYARTFRDMVEDQLRAPTAQMAVRRLLRTFAERRSEPGLPRTCLVFDESRLAGEREWARGRVARRIAQGDADGEPVGATDPERLSTFVDVVMAGLNARARVGATREQLLDVVDTAMDAWPRG